MQVQSLAQNHAIAWIASGHLFRSEYPFGSRRASNAP
jgi:hypothetical protein